MKIIQKPLELKQFLKKFTQKTIGFVPTMGALHEGHISLIKQARQENEIVIVSIFVNPTQFLKGEDLDKYPRKDEADKKICEFCGVDVLFFPQIEDIYTKDEVGVLAPKVRGFILEGASRVGHFNGVLQIVNKLLHVVNPTKAYFGKKDAQQLFLIQEMVKNFFMDVEIIPMDTIRDKDGLALSSRNVYLDENQRKEALKIPASLHKASSILANNQLDVKTIKQEMLKVLHPLHVEYVEILTRDFKYIQHVEIGNSIILVEAIVGNTRLLDNIWI